MRERPFVADMVKDTPVPRMFKVRQTFPRPRIHAEEIPGIIKELLSEEKFFPVCGRECGLPSRQVRGESQM